MEIVNNCNLSTVDMPSTKKPLKRYSILDRCFSNTGRNYTFESLREAVNYWTFEKDPQSKGISTRYLRDDIAFIKSSVSWETLIETCPGLGKKRHYRYDDPKFSILQRLVNETQIEELKMLLDALIRNVFIILE